MRHISLLVCSLSLLSAGLGCSCLNHTAGVCDCDADELPCTHRAPWAAPLVPAPTATTAPAPAPWTPMALPLPSPEK